MCRCLRAMLKICKPLRYHTATFLREYLIIRQEFVKAIVSHVEAGIMAINANGELTLVNRTARMIHGLPDEQETLPLHSTLVMDLRGTDIMYSSS